MIFKRSFKTDRRRRRRQLVNTSVKVFTESVRVDAVGINISDAGMGLFAIAHLPLASQIQLEFLLPEGREPVRLSGIVRHRALYLYGIEFLPDPDQNAGLRADAAADPSREGFHP